MAELSFKYVHVNGIRLHIATAGPKDGEMIILLHGFPEFWRAWEQQMHKLAEEGYFVVAPDQRGYHLSAKPSGPASYTMDTLRDDIIGLISHFKREKAVIVGHDWGGAAGWYMALTRPEYISLFIPVNMPHLTAMPKTMLTHPMDLLKGYYMAAFQLPSLPDKGASMFQYAALKAHLTVTSCPGAFSKQELDGYQFAWSQPGSVTAMFNWFRAIPFGPADAMSTETINAPVRMIWGMHDWFLGTAAAKESLKYCSDGAGVFIEEATHWVHHEQPELVTQFIKSFIQENQLGGNTYAEYQL